MMLTMARLCLASYSPYDEYKQIAADLGYEIVNASMHPTINWKLLECDDHCVFVYPGTNDWTDVIADIMAGSVKTSFGHVHHGVNSRWDEIQMEVPYPRKPTYLAGHSLGGAMAKRHAMDRVIHQVFTFNAPRIFDAVAAKNYDVPTSSYVIKGDWVHRAPLFYTTATKPIVLDAKPGENKHAMQTCYDAATRYLLK